MEQSPEHEHLVGRVTGLESEVKHIATTVDHMEAAMSKNLAEMRTMFDQLRSTVSRHHQVNWPLIVSALAMFLILGGIGVNYINMRQIPQAQAIEYLTIGAVAHETLNGHPISMALYSKQEQKLTAADSSIASLKELLITMEREDRDWREDSRARILRLEHGKHAADAEYVARHPQDIPRKH